MLFTINPQLLPQLPPMPVKSARYSIPSNPKLEAHKRREIAKLHEPFVKAEQRQAKAQVSKPSFRNVVFGVIALLRRWLRKLSIALAVPSVQQDYDWPARPYVSIKGQPI